MKKTVFLLLAAFSATSALAGEVDAQNPQVASSTSGMTVAIADTGVSTSWTRAPVSVKALADRSEQLQNLNDDISAWVSADLERRIAQKLELSFIH